MRRALALVLALAAFSARALRQGMTLLVVLTLAVSSARADPTHFSGPVDSKNGFTVSGQPCISSSATLVGTCATGGGGSVLSAVVDLTTAEIATLNSAPVTIVPAQGVGTAIVPIYGSFQYLAGASPFANNADVRLGYPATDHQEISTASAVTWSQTTSTYQPMSRSISGDHEKPQVEVDNAPLEASAPMDPSLTGSILTSAVNVPGTGYAPGDTGTIANPLAGTTALYTVDTVDGGGGVLTYHLTTNGSQYSLQGNLATTVSTGGGDGAFTIDVNSITPLSDGVARVQVLYYVMTLR